MPREAPVTRAMREARGAVITVYTFVMPGLDPGIHVFAAGITDVDGRDKPGHDGKANQVRRGRADFIVMDYRPRSSQIPNSLDTQPFGQPLSRSCPCIS